MQKENDLPHVETMSQDFVLPDGLYAHSLASRPLSEWQRLDTHLEQVAAMASEFAESFGAGQWAWAAGLLHDLGKAHPAFQRYIRSCNDIDDPAYDKPGAGGRVNHSSAGAAYAVDRFDHWGHVLAYLVAGHHAGLPDYHPGDSGTGALTVRCDDGRKQLREIGRVAEAVRAALPSLPKPPRFLRPENLHLWVRMLFSCVADADFLDTERFMSPARYAERGRYASLEQLQQALDARLAELEKESEDTAVNRARRTVLADCRQKARKEKPGLFSLTVPTGGGKTLSSAAFALDHAIRHGKARVIYVIPYTSIIEQTAETLRDIFGAENVAEHHSGLDPETQALSAQLAAENWDAPIVVTTAVQFFESLYAARPGRCRKLHRIAGSVVILDEAQMIPPGHLSTCVGAIKELVTHYDTSMVLCTATQPALPDLGRVTEIVEDPEALYRVLKRTDIRLPEDWKRRTPLEETARLLEAHEQVLCIVNTRRDCRDLHALMPEGTIHLSTLLCGQHRSERIAEIKQRLKDGEPVRVVSTQLVEAGVDIDFPVVYRAEAGLDSIVQAAGRCNREGGRRDGYGLVRVFTTPKLPPLGQLRKGAETTAEMVAIGGLSFDDPQAFPKYFALYYSRGGEMGPTGETDRVILKHLKADDRETLPIEFRRAARAFRMIDDQGACPVFVAYGEGEGLIRQLREAGPDRNLLRRLQRYTVNVPKRIADDLLGKGLIDETRQGYRFQNVASVYDKVTGLNIYAEGMSVEELMPE